MQSTEKVILSGDDKFYRIVWYAFDRKKCVSPWMKDKALAQAWLRESDRSIPSVLEETLNVSSLGGDTLLSMEKKLAELNKKLQVIKPGSQELRENIQTQINTITVDIQILKNNPKLKVTHFLDFQEQHRIIA